jgi:poly-beta-1,6-N-acetyl-D-glucosamine N-deacetylase
MRNLIRKAIANIFIILGFVRVQNNRVHTEGLVTPIYFHDPSKELFEKCINWLIKNNYHFISTDDLYMVLKNKTPLKKGAVCITVDDGKKGNLKNIVPFVEKLKIPITIFISTEPVKKGVFWWSYVKAHNNVSSKKISIQNCKSIANDERLKIINKLKENLEIPREAMTKEEVIKISKSTYITIGNHTVNHPIIPSCEIDELEYEISEASNLLKSWISKDINYFAYPNGDFDQREIATLKSNNIKLAFTTIPEHVNVTKPVNYFQIPRFSVNDNGSFYENICKMTGVWQKIIK